MSFSKSVPTFLVVLVAAASLLISISAFVSLTFADPGFQDLNPVAGNVESLSKVPAGRDSDYRISLIGMSSSYSLMRCPITSAERVLVPGTPVVVWVVETDHDPKTVWQLTVGGSNVCLYEDAVAWSERNRWAALVVGVAFAGVFLYSVSELRRRLLSS